MSVRTRMPAALAAVAALSLLSGCEPCSRDSGTICTIAGTGKAALGGEKLQATATPLYLAEDVTAGSDGLLYVMDWNNHRVRRLNADGTLETIIGSGELGDGQDGNALTVALNHPTDVSFDPSGTMYLAAWHNSKVMRYDAESGELVRVAGTGKRSFGGDNGPATEAILDLPVTVAFRDDGNMYIADQANARIRMVDGAGVITTVVGRGTHGFSGDNGPAIEAELKAPVGQAASPAGKIVLDAQDNLIIADSGNNRVRRVDAKTWTITTIAGVGGEPTGEANVGGDNGPATDAHLARPTDVAVGPDGSIYIADTDNSCIRKVDPEGIIKTVAGICGQTGFDGDNGPATEAKLNRPFGIDVDANGVLYIADTYNHRVRAVYP
ncbi:MAG: hypothetical protein IRZ16_01545 [Myxococcaceae bacterium]|nr:hypothetical protein [Myxococcaceae bacterium]